MLDLICLLPDILYEVCASEYEYFPISCFVSVVSDAVTAKSWERFHVFQISN